MGLNIKAVLGKIGVPILGAVLIAVTVFTLQFFMNRLLLRDARVDGMRWAQNIEKRLENIEGIFAGNFNYWKVLKSLQDTSFLGQIYHYEFVNTADQVVFATGTYVPAEDGKPAEYFAYNKSTGIFADPSMEYVEVHQLALAYQKHLSSTNLNHVDEANEVINFHSHLTAENAPHEKGKGRIDLQNGDGVTQPKYFAEIQHIVFIDGKYAGKINVFLDQTEKHDLFQETIFALFIVLTSIIIFGFIVSIQHYFRGKMVIQKAQDNAQFFADHDQMTQLFNRNRFVRLVDNVLKGQDLSDGYCALHFINIDNFKLINDMIGNKDGDAVLKILSQRLNEAVSFPHIKARVGGDEFAVLQVGIQSDDEVVAFAMQLRPVFFGTCQVGGRDVTTTASMGISIAPRDGSNSEALIKSAVAALHSVKATSRGNYALFQQEMLEEQDKQINLERTIRDANENELFELYFQPLYCSKTRNLTSFEALIRMKGGDGTFIPPDRFIPLAEQMGLMVDIGSWVLRRATEIAATWPEHISIAVNLSVKQFEQGNLFKTVNNALANSGLDPKRLELEITEGLIMQNSDWNLRQLRELKVLGVSIAMDDFGTGYSSLSYLWRFPFDKIKIDQSFLKGLTGDPQKVTEIIRTIIGLGHTLDMVVTAEGVESAEQLEMLQEMKCDLIQGFYLGRPLNLEQVAALLLTELQAFHVTGKASEEAQFVA